MRASIQCTSNYKKFGQQSGAFSLCINSKVIWPSDLLCRCTPDLCVHLFNILKCERNAKYFSRYFKLHFWRNRFVITDFVTKPQWVEFMFETILYYIGCFKFFTDIISVIQLIFGRNVFLTIVPKQFFNSWGAIMSNELFKLAENVCRYSFYIQTFLWFWQFFPGNQTLSTISSVAVQVMFSHA